MRNIIINEVLIPALRKLYETDYDNIRFGVSERNICARLSLHMENIRLIGHFAGCDIC